MFVSFFMMTAFNLHIVLAQGPTWIRVDEARPKQWHDCELPEYWIELNGKDGLVLMTLQREDDGWHDQTIRLAETNTYLRYLQEGWDDSWNPDYKSPLTTE